MIIWFKLWYLLVEEISFLLDNFFDFFRAKNKVFLLILEYCCDIIS